MLIQCLRLSALLVFASGPLWGAEGDAGPTPSPLRLTLEQCVERGIERNTEFLRAEENLVLEKLAYAVSRHAYDPLFAAALSGEVNQDETTGQTAEASVSKNLFTNGQLSLTGTSTGAQDEVTAEDSYNSSVSLSLVQPLLRGAGRTQYRDTLTQAEHDLLYARHDLILFRQDFVIGIVQQFYGIVQQSKAIANQEERLANARDLLERTRALEASGTSSRIDVLRAELNLLQAENSLAERQQDLRLALDNLKVDLNVPTDTSIEIVQPALEFKPIPVDLVEATRSALRNRLELKTARSQLDDAKRALDIARNELRAQLDLAADFGYSTEMESRFADQAWGSPEWSVELKYALPLDRVNEKATYRQRLIAYLQQIRAVRRLEDETTVEVRATVRQLQRTQQTIDIQARSVEVAEKRLERALSDFDRGKIANRDVVEAQNELLNAKNDYDRAVVEHIVAKLQLLRDTGTLDFSRWREYLQ